MNIVIRTVAATLLLAVAGLAQAQEKVQFPSLDHWQGTGRLVS